VRVLFLGSPPFGTPILERLAASPFRPSLVVTPPARPRGRGRKLEPQPLAERAEALGLALLQPRSVRDPEVMARLAEARADVFVVASYGELLRQAFLDLPRVGCLNVHPSLLPRWRGATPVPAAILAGDEVTGVSIQRIVLELDAGDVLIARASPVGPDETAGELLERMARLGAEVLVEGLARIEDGSATFTPQDPAGITHCRKLTKEDGRLDWTRPAGELARRVRAMNPWPGGRTVLPEGGELSVWRASVAGDAGEPGTVLSVDGRLVVACGSGALVLEEIQAPGKRRMGAAEWLRGARLAAGERLGG